LAYLGALECTFIYNWASHNSVIASVTGENDDYFDKDYFHGKNEMLPVGF
jgi:hypothetical protein